MTINDAENYLVKKIEEAGLVVIERKWPPNIDALVLMVGPQDGAGTCALAISHLELEMTKDAPALLDCRVEQARCMVSELAA